MFFSTRNINDTVDGRTAILNGLADCGGLYVPDSIPVIDYKMLRGLPYRDLAKRILGAWFNDFSPEEIADACEGAYQGHFDTEIVCPVVEAGNKIIVELFHGETCAFKDVALSILPRLMSKARISLGRKQKILILTATSGDTGSAAMNGFKDVDGTGIITFYPNNGVSPVQRKQMVCMEGSNLTACAVNGNFDDCQSAVKMAFATLPKSDNYVYSSANSINIARLVPQIVYYFSTYLTLLEKNAINENEKMNFVVPTGNFGDILAGWYAKKMGLPIGKLICASNSNRVLTDFINSGIYDKRREFVRTYSPSMDILISSNLERLLYYVCGESTQYVADKMKELKECGVYTIDPEMQKAVREDFTAYSFDDKHTVDTIRSFYEECGYVLDPHTAVAAAAEKAFRQAHPDEKCVILSTASPFKFPSCICNAINIDECTDSFDTLRKLSERVNSSVPAQLMKLEDKAELHKDCIERDQISEYVLKEAEFLLKL